MYSENRTIMPKNYLTPKSIEETIELLKKYGQQACVLAGGTDLFVDKTSLRETIIDISEAGLEYVHVDKVGLRIGACTKFFSLIEKLQEGPFSILAEAARNLGTPQVRNIGTIGGNLCTAAPSADSAPSLYVLKAKVKLTGPQGSRVVAIEDFMTGPGETALKPDEILEEIHVSVPPDEQTFFYFDKVVRTKGHDLSIVNGALAIAFDADKKGKTVRICLGAVAPTPIRAKEAEKALMGKRLSEDLIEQAAEKAADATKPISDVRGSAAYRKLRSRVMVKRALLAAMKTMGS